METAVLVIGIGILAIVAYGDLRTRRIPNVLSTAIAILGLVRIILVHDQAAAGYTLAAGSATFLVVFLLFQSDAIGGGDAKLIAAMALLIGYHDLFSFFFLMSVCGGVLALAILARDKLRPQWWRLSQLIKREVAKPAGELARPAASTVPYGVAIATAGVITLLLEAPIVR